MIKCPRCGNEKQFREVLYGGVFVTPFKQDKKGEFKKTGNMRCSDDHEVVVKFHCGECGKNLDDKHSEFLAKYLG